MTQSLRPEKEVRRLKYSTFLKELIIVLLDSCVVQSLHKYYICTVCMHLLNDVGIARQLPIETEECAPKRCA